MMSLPSYLCYSLTCEELIYIFGDNDRGMYYIFDHGYKSSLSSHTFKKNGDDKMCLSITCLSRKLNQYIEGDNEGFLYHEYFVHKSERKVNEDSYDEAVTDMVENYKCAYQYRAIISNLTSLEATHHAYEIRSFNDVNGKELANKAIINYYIQTVAMLREIEPCYLLLFLLSEYNYLNNRNHKDVNFIDMDISNVDREIERVEKLLKLTWKDLYGFSLDI